FMTDGLYVYMIPPSSSGDGLIRVDLANYGTVEVLSASGRGLNQVGWSEAGFMDDYYGYLPPQHDESLVVRFDQATFQEFLTLDISQAHSSCKGFSGGFTDGTDAFLVPSQTSYVCKFDLATFGGSDGSGNPGTLNYLNLQDTDANLQSFMPGFQVNGYGYLAPSSNGRLVRFPTSFSGMVDVINLELTDSGFIQFASTVTDGTYGYLVPSSSNGKAVRYSLDPFQYVDFKDLSTMW
ncbi:unnamed protein product, partial [Durusdinium trenchii]